MYLGTHVASNTRVVKVNIYFLLGNLGLQNKATNCITLKILLFLIFLSTGGIIQTITVKAKQ